MMSAAQFIELLNQSLSPLVLDGRTVTAVFSKGFAPGPGRGSIAVNFFNLPTPRVKERRGGGAENENNRQLFMIWGFGVTEDDVAEKVKLEQSTNGIGSSSTWAPRMRAKTGAPEKVAPYLAAYINKVAESFPPNFTHE